MNKIVAFVSEIKSEIKKITWPTKDELVGATIIVCVVALIFAAILGSMDFVFSYLIRHFIL